MTAKHGLEVDRRVGIALSVLPGGQRAAIERIIASRSAFDQIAAQPGRVHTLPASGVPLTLLRATPTLRLVFTEVGDAIHVIDLIDRATLRHFEAKSAREKALTRPAGDLVDS